MPEQHGQRDSNHTNANTKVAIPKLGGRNNSAGGRAHEKGRVVNACASCRKRKVKCTGQRPRCKNCEDNAAPCDYTQVRKDRLKIATDQNVELVQLLRDLSLRVNEGDRKAIANALDSVGDEFTATVAPSSINTRGKRQRTEYDLLADDDFEKALVSDEDDDDFVDEDLLRNREARATGFIGQNSEIQWLRGLRSQMKAWKEEPHVSSSTSPDPREPVREKSLDPSGPPRRTPPRPEDIFNVTDSTYYLDGESLDIETSIDPYELPPPRTAEKLVDCYMKTVHSSFPILPKTFEHQFRKYYESIRQGQPLQVKEKWQAMLNIVFGIGARWACLVNAEWQVEDHDHIIYMQRAMRLLESNGVIVLVSAPDLATIQATGLLSLYYLIIGHVSRAWVMIGIALRFALAVGLHIRNEDPHAPLHRKELHVRLWWGLNAVESLLSAMTGRPCIIDDKNCTVPLPILLQEELMQNTPSGLDSKARSQSKSTDRSGSSLSEHSSPANTVIGHASLPGSDSSKRSVVHAILGSFLDARVRISRLSQKVLSSLYSPHTDSWEHSRKTMASLLSELDEWAVIAIPDTPARPTVPTSDSDIHRERLLLGFHYFSTKLLITRPSLGRTEPRQKVQSYEFLTFDQNMAGACIEAAKGMTTLLPDQPDADYVYRRGPWWAIVHYMMQALAVFLIELSQRGSQDSRQDGELSTCVNKLIDWLQSMRDSNPIADRAVIVILDVIENGDPRAFADLRQPLKQEPQDTHSQGPAWPPTSDHTFQVQGPASRFQNVEWDPVEWAFQGQEIETESFPRPSIESPRAGFVPGLSTSEQNISPPMAQISDELEMMYNTPYDWQQGWQQQ